jgi:hypothetical protein
MKKHIILFFLILFSTSQLFSQKVLGGLKNKIGNRLNEKLEDAIVDKVFEESDSAAKSGDSSYYNKWLSGQGNPFLFEKCSIKPSYFFHHKAIIEITTVGKKKSQNSYSKMAYYINKDSFNICTEILAMNRDSQITQKTKSIIDLTDSCIISLSEVDGNKIATSMKYGKYMNKAIDDQLDSSYERPKKTGASKMISGKKCFEFVSEDEETKQSYWIEESKVNLWEMSLEDMQSNIDLIKDQYSFSNYFEFFPVLIITTDKKDGLVTTMQVIETIYNLNKTISTSGYQPY